MNITHMPFAYRLAYLSHRELRAACLYADGCTNKQVFEWLGTVSQTRSIILRKLGLQAARELRYYRAELKARAGIIT